MCSQVKRLCIRHNAMVTASKTKKKRNENKHETLKWRGIIWPMAILRSTDLFMLPYALRMAGRKIAAPMIKKNNVPK